MEIVTRIFNFTVINWIDTLTSDGRLSLEKPDMFVDQICLHIGICTKLTIIPFWSVLTYDLLEDKRIDDVINTTFSYKKQVDSMVRTSAAYSAIASCALYHILLSSVIYYWTDAREHGIYYISKKQKVINLVSGLRL